jgi:hypothetical protein
MATLGQRILRRAVPAGIITGLIGYFLTWGYLSAIRALANVTVDTDGPNYLYPILMGLAGFGIMAAIESVKPPSPQT